MVVRTGTGDFLLVCDLPGGGEGVPYDIDRDDVVDECGPKPMPFPGFPAMTSCATDGFVLVTSTPEVTSPDMCVPGFGTEFDHPGTTSEFGLVQFPRVTERCPADGSQCTTTSPSLILPVAALDADCQQREIPYVPVDGDADGIFERCLPAVDVWEIPPTWNVFGGSQSVVARHQIDCRVGLQWLSPADAEVLRRQCTYTIAPGGSDCEITSTVTEVDRDDPSNLVQMDVTQLLCAATVTPE